LERQASKDNPSGRCRGERQRAASCHQHVKSPSLHRELPRRAYLFFSAFLLLLLWMMKAALRFASNALHFSSPLLPTTATTFPSILPPCHPACEEHALPRVCLPFTRSMKLAGACCLSRSPEHLRHPSQNTFRYAPFILVFSSTTAYTSGREEKRAFVFFF
jgi:hypothetical protein